MSGTTSAFLTGLMLLLATPAFAADWPDVPLPEGSQAEWVSRHMVYNGVHMRASRFTSTRTLDQIEAFYHEQWGDEMVRNTLGRKRILGHRDGDHYITVDLQSAGGGTEANVGIVDMDAPTAGHPPGYGMPKPANTEVVNDIRYLDANEARTVLMHNTLSPGLNHDFYLRRLSGQGWRHEGGSECLAVSAGCAARFVKPGSHLSLTFTRAPNGEGTMVMANQVDE